MAARRSRDRSEGIVSGEVVTEEAVTVKTYKVVSEFDGCDEKHYSVGEVSPLTHWPDWAVQNVLLGGLVTETWVEEIRVEVASETELVVEPLTDEGG